MPVSGVHALHATNLVTARFHAGSLARHPLAVTLALPSLCGVRMPARPPLLIPLPEPLLEQPRQLPVPGAVSAQLVQHIHRLARRIVAHAHPVARVRPVAKVQPVVKRAHAADFPVGDGPQFEVFEYLTARARHFAQVHVAPGPLVALAQGLGVAEECLAQPLGRHVQIGGPVRHPPRAYPERLLVDPARRALRGVVGIEGDGAAAADGAGLDGAQGLHTVKLGQFLKPQVAEKSLLQLDALAFLRVVRTAQQNPLTRGQVLDLHGAYLAPPAVGHAQRLNRPPQLRQHAVAQGVGHLAVYQRVGLGTAHHPQDDLNAHKAALAASAPALQPVFAVPAKADVGMHRMERRGDQPGDSYLFPLVIFPRI